MTTTTTIRTTKITTPFSPWAISATSGWRWPYMRCQRMHLLLYRDLEFSVIPLHRGTKQPVLPEWKPHRSRLPTEEELNAWFSPTERNVALVLGRLSQMVVVDVDGAAAKTLVERKLVELGYGNNLRGAMLHTMMTKTGGGGYHFLFRVDEPELFDEFDLRTKPLALGEGPHEEVKFLGEGSLSILAPSLHPSGGAYVWNGRLPEVLGKRELKQLFNLFGKEKTLLKQSSLPLFSSSGEGGGNRWLTPLEIEKTLIALREHNMYVEGRRQDTVLGLAAKFRKEKGICRESMLELVSIVCHTFHDEELPKRLRAVHDTYDKPIDRISWRRWFHEE
jgi:Bifunctional DNA primase/polymerase, N-terminal